MMSITENAFSILGLQPGLVWTESELDLAYRKAAAVAHPDAGGSQERFERVQQARSILRSPSKRLILWLELMEIAYESRGELDAQTMDLFSKVSEVCQSAEALIKRREGTLSALGRAMMESAAQEQRQRLSEAIQILDEAIQRESSRFGWFETNAAHEPGEVCRCARNLAFLEKWHQNLRSLFGRLV